MVNEPGKGYIHCYYRGYFKPCRLRCLLQQHLIALPFTEPTLPYDSYAILNLLRLLPFGDYPLTNGILWLLYIALNSIARLLPAEWHTRPPEEKPATTTLPAIRRSVSKL